MPFRQLWIVDQITEAARTVALADGGVNRKRRLHLIGRCEFWKEDIGMPFTIVAVYRNSGMLFRRKQRVYALHFFVMNFIPNSQRQIHILAGCVGSLTKCGFG